MIAFLTSLRRLIKTLCLVLLSSVYLFVLGCGQKGPLVKAEPEKTTEQQPQSSSDKQQ